MTTRSPVRNRRAWRMKWMQRSETLEKQEIMSSIMHLIRAEIPDQTRHSDLLRKTEQTGDTCDLLESQTDTIHRK